MSTERPPPGDGELLLLEPKYHILTYEARFPHGNRAAPLLGSFLVFRILVTGIILVLPLMMIVACGDPISPMTPKPVL